MSHVHFVSRLALLAGLAACGETDGDPGGLNLAGKPGDQAAQVVVMAYCEREARCGRPVVECKRSTPVGGTASRTCSGIIQPVETAACSLDLSRDLMQMLACKPLTDAEAELVESCFEPWIARPCITQAQADEAARTSEQTGTSPDLKMRPAACDQMLMQLGGRCPRQ